MSAERYVPAARAPGLSRAWPVAVVMLAAAACSRDAIQRYSAMEWSPDRSRVAFARDRLCPEGPCQTLFIGKSIDTASAVEGLADGREWADDIAWTKDGRRVAFLVNGRQLRIYDAETAAPAGKVNLFGDESSSADRVARGITFSDNGAAVTFDDCPRDRAGCRAGMIGIR